MNELRGPTVYISHSYRQLIPNTSLRFAMKRMSSAGMLRSSLASSRKCGIVEELWEQEFLWSPRSLCMRHHPLSIVLISRFWSCSISNVALLSGFLWSTWVGSVRCPLVLRMLLLSSGTIVLGVSGWCNYILGYVEKNDQWTHDTKSNGLSRIIRIRKN